MPSPFVDYPAVLSNLVGYGPYKSVIVACHDGDTIALLIDTGFSTFVCEWIRLRAANVGINAPELSTPEGKTALEFLQGFCPVGTPLQLVSQITPRSRDQAMSFTRYVGWLIDAQGVDIGQKMLDSGHAVPWP